MSPEITVWVHRRKIIRRGKAVDGYSANCDPHSPKGVTAADRETVVAHMVAALKKSNPEANIVVKDAP